MFHDEIGPDYIKGVTASAFADRSPADQYLVQRIAARDQVDIESLAALPAHELAAIYLLAVVLHTAWDSAVNPLVYLVIALISLVALAGTAHRLAAAPEHRPDTEAAQHC